MVFFLLSFVFFPLYFGAAQPAASPLSMSQNSGGWTHEKKARRKSSCFDINHQRMLVSLLSTVSCDSRFVEERGTKRLSHAVESRTIRAQSVMSAAASTLSRVTDQPPRGSLPTSAASLRQLQTLRTGISGRVQRPVAVCVHAPCVRALWPSARQSAVPDNPVLP
jgi:hypothetical protein